MFDFDFADSSRERIAAAPVFLDHKGLLWCAQDCVRVTDEEIREVLTDSGLHFLDGLAMPFQSTAALVADFKLKHLWALLERQLPGGRTVALKDAPIWMNNVRMLYRLYRAMRRTSEVINKADVARLPICLDRFERLHPPGHLFLPDGEPILYSLLDGDSDAPLAAKPIYDNKEYHLLYHILGVKPFDWDMLVERMATVARDETTMAEQTHPCLQSRECLIQLYRYLNGKRGDIERSDKYMQKLRHHIPLWLCRDEVLRTAKELFLPSDEGSWPSCIRVNNVVDVDSKEGLTPFFRDILNLQPITHARFIERYLIGQYAALTPKEQMDVLRYLRDQIRLLRTDGRLLHLVQESPLLYGDDDQPHPAPELCFPDEFLRQLFPNHLRFPHKARYIGRDPLPKDLLDWHWYDLFSTLGVTRYAPPNCIVAEITLLTKRPASDQHARETSEKIFRYLEDNWDQYTVLGGTLRSMAWLPADGDETTWYSPSDLYPRPEKPLVDQVAKVIGFREARRAKEAIAAALGFPTASNNISLVVQQLIKLSEGNLRADKEIYRVLGRDTVKPEMVLPFHGLPVFYDEAAQCYWKAEQMLLVEHRSSFGSYRGYMVESEYRPLLKKLGATGVPFAQDYVELICNISARHRDDVPVEAVALLKNAYTHLATERDDKILSPLRTIHSVLSKIGDEPYHMRKPNCVLLQPPQRYLDYLPDLPVAYYAADGVTTLERIGVRSIEDVLQEGFEVKPDTSHPVNLSKYFKRLEHPLKRVLYHYDQIDRAHMVWEQIKKLRAYEQQAIRVVYQVKLADKTYRSQLLPQDMFYDAKNNTIYLQCALREALLHWELAQVIYQIVRLENPPLLALFREVIDHPEQARDTLDRSKIKSLPDDAESALQLLERIMLAGPSINIPGEPCTFRATIAPVTATPPFTYSWQINGKIVRTTKEESTTIDQYTCTFPTSGTYTLCVTAQGKTGKAVEDTRTILIQMNETATPVPPARITVSGVTTGIVGKPQPFTASISPADATPPLNYAWTVDGQLVPDTQSATLVHTWDIEGTKHIAVTVSNVAGTQTGTYRIAIEPLPPPTPPAQVSIRGDHDGVSSNTYTFVSVVEPANTSQPLRYEWRVDERVVDSREQTLRHSWNNPGSKQVVVLVSNESGQAQGHHNITICPQFKGVTEFKSPSIPIDWHGLRERVHIWVEQHRDRLTHLPSPPLPRNKLTPFSSNPIGPHTVRFTLSYPEVEYGFLRLHQKACALFEKNPVRVMCRTEHGQDFHLYLDWQRDPPIAYSQPVLRNFFNDHRIPAGGMVYLEKLHTDQYRIFYHAQPPRTVRHVRLASPDIQNGQATVSYEIIGEQTVECEIDEAIYRAEQRFGDWAALLIESIGKKAVVETLCDIFMRSDDIWLHSDDLDALLNAQRMVAASTVPQTLGQYSFFEKSGEYWRLDPQKVLEEESAPGSDLVQRWCGATDKLLAYPPLLTDERIRPTFNKLRQHLESARAPLSGLTDSPIAQLNNEPDNDYLQQQVTETIVAIITQATNLSANNELRQILHHASSEIWSNLLRPTLSTHIAALQKQHEYIRCADIAELWLSYDGNCPVNVQQIQREAQAWSFINTPAPAVQHVLQAIAIAPTLIVAFKKLHEAVQRELQMRSWKDWLSYGKSEAVVQAFYTHVETLFQARPYLQKEHQQAFDLTIQQKMTELWEHLKDDGKLSLTLQLRNYLPDAYLTDSQLQHLLYAAQQMRQQHPLVALLLGMFIWRMCSDHHSLQREIANHLAHCHLKLDICEIALSHQWKKPQWKKHIDHNLLATMHTRNLAQSATHMPREYAVLKQVKGDTSQFIHLLLKAERQTLLAMLEKDIQSLASSASS